MDQQPDVRSANFREALARYAELLVTFAMNVQPEQLVVISGEACHIPLLRQIADVAYREGAGYVHAEIADPYLLRSRLRHSSESLISRVPSFVRARFDELVETGGATLRLVGAEEPGLLKEIKPARLNLERSAIRKAVKRFYVEGVDGGKVQWTVAPAATEGWAGVLLPDEPEATRLMRLWSELFRIVRVDRPDPIAALREHDTRLRERAKILSEMGIERLRFSGGGTDLSVSFSERAIFKGGSEVSAAGVRFEPNLPTEECYSTPDWRGTEGSVRVTRPVLVHGVLVEGLVMHFKAGELVGFSADSGRDVFESLINTDQGARRLGEVALVGIDSPVYRSGIVFRETLLDENAACHVALGFAYRGCLRGGNQMSEEELAHHGCNDSLVHMDMMISSEEVSVDATMRDGAQRRLIDRGSWCAIEL
jgi:aminopeptidase